MRQSNTRSVSCSRSTRAGMQPLWSAHLQYCYQWLDDKGGIHAFNSPTIEHDILHFSIICTGVLGHQRIEPILATVRLEMLWWSLQVCTSISNTTRLAFVTCLCLYQQIRQRYIHIDRKRVTYVKPIQLSYYRCLQKCQSSSNTINFVFVHTPSAYFVSIILRKGESGSGATDEIMINIEPVASVGKMAGNTSGLKKRNSSHTTNEISAPTPRKL